MKTIALSKEARDPLTEKIIGCAIEVHRQLGPGLLESTYQQCLAYELQVASLSFQIQCPMPVLYKGVKLDCGYRLDLFVQKRVIVELKTVQFFERIHEAQLLTYMKLAKASVGLLINFNVKLLRSGIRRYVL